MVYWRVATSELSSVTFTVKVEVTPDVELPAYDSLEVTKTVTEAADSLSASGLVTLSQDATDCCYAIQDKVWVSDQDGVPWEWYTVLSDTDTETFEESTIPQPSGVGVSACCS